MLTEIMTKQYPRLNKVIKRNISNIVI